MRIFAIALLAFGKRSQAFSTAPNRGFDRTSTTLRMSKRVLVPIADGSEEIETTCITDTLTRFGADVTIASVMPEGQLVCKMSRGIKVRLTNENRMNVSSANFNTGICRCRRQESLTNAPVLLRLWQTNILKMLLWKNSTLSFAPEACLVR